MTYANSADPDQTAPEGAVWSGSTLFAIPLSILRNSCIKSKIKARIVWNKVFEILGHLPYFEISLPQHIRFSRIEEKNKLNNYITQMNM